MSITNLYNTWMPKIKQMLPGERITRIRVLAWLLAGIFESKSVHLSKVASKIIKNGLRYLVDRADHRDLSLFRIGLYMRERYLANQKVFQLDLYPIL